MQNDTLNTTPIDFTKGTNNFIYLIEAYGNIVEAIKLMHSKLDTPYRTYIELDTYNSGLPLNERLYTPLFYASAYRTNGTYHINFAVNDDDPFGKLLSPVFRDIVKKFTSKANIEFDLEDAVHEIEYHMESYSIALIQFGMGNHAYRPTTIPSSQKEA